MTKQVRMGEGGGVQLKTLKNLVGEGAYSGM